MKSGDNAKGKKTSEAREPKKRENAERERERDKYGRGGDLRSDEW